MTRPQISRYLLLALERTVRKEKEPEMVPNSNEDEVNLEHIPPRNAKQADWPDFAPEEVTPWANRLGNHALLKKSENARIGNKAWATKKPILEASSLRLTKKAGKPASGRRRRSSDGSGSWRPTQLPLGLESHSEIFLVPPEGRGTRRSD
jgi:hypothetical protein